MKKTSRNKGSKPRGKKPSKESNQTTEEVESKLKTTKSREPAAGAGTPKRKSKDKSILNGVEPRKSPAKHDSNKKKPSCEKTDKGVDTNAQIGAVTALCSYVNSMNESVGSYFDKNLATYTNSTQTATTEWARNMSKNRSKSHKMLDHSRVIVKEEPTIYLNASLVSFDEIEMDFIVTQYPMPESTLDFWKMVRLEQIDRIITIFEPTTDEAIEEFHKIPDSTMSTPISAVNSPASVMQPSLVGKSVRCEPVGTKSLFPLFADNYYNIEEWLINTKKVEMDERNKLWLSVYSVEIVQGGCSNGILTRVFNCSTWPWKSIPSDEKRLLALAHTPWKNLTPTYEPVAGSKIAKQVRHKPVVVMCDLGLDRSATVVFTAVLIEMLLAGKKPDCDALFRKFRDQRAGVFTNSMFYTAAIRAALVYMKAKLGKLECEGSRQMFDAIGTALLKLPSPKKK